MVTRERHL